jgi:hypothetical protein
MKGIGLLIIALGFAGFGVFMLISGEIAVGLLSVLVGAAGLVGVLLRTRGGSFGLAAVGVALFAAMGVVLIVATPVRHYRGGFLESPAGVRMFGIVLLAVCVLAAAVLIARRVRRSGHRGMPPAQPGPG